MNLESYFFGAVAHTEARAHRMLESIPGTLPRDYDALVETLLLRINGSLAELEKLRSPEMLEAKNAAVRLRTLKREAAHLATIEQYALPALVRALPPDNEMNRLVHTLKRETGFPFVAPVVSPFTGDYFNTELNLKIILVPLLESSSLLHLPDLYHELAHHLVIAAENPKLKELYEQLLSNGGDVDDHFREAVQEVSRGFSPAAHADMLNLYRACWISSWLMEFYCDIFAAACLGPAYGWAHLLLNVKRSPNPYRLPVTKPSRHPPDHARMQAILQTLSSLGYSSAVHRMNALWDQFLAQQSHRREPEYEMALPAPLLELTVQRALAGFRDSGCHFAEPDRFKPVALLMNQAWELFLEDPAAFLLQERELTQRLFAACAG